MVYFDIGWMTCYLDPFYGAFYAYGKKSMWKFTFHQQNDSITYEYDMQMINVKIYIFSMFKSLL